jgi:hypothetical protein
MAKRQFSTHISNPETIDALHDGVPEWMRNSLDDWIKTLGSFISLKDDCVLI